MPRIQRAMTTKPKKKPTVVCAYAEPCSGTGWANRPIWVIVRYPNGTLAQECVQPSEQSDEQLILYGIAARVQGEMTRAERNRRDGIE